MKYAETHEWAKKEGNLFVVGVTEFAASELGDVTYVELPEVGDKFEQTETFGTIESVKTVSPLHLPVGGEIVEVNEEIEDNPGLVNEDAEGAGWLCKVKPTNPADYDKLMDKAAYDKSTQE